MYRRLFKQLPESLIQVKCSDDFSDETEFAYHYKPGLVLNVSGQVEGIASFVNIRKQHTVIFPIFGF